MPLERPILCDRRIDNNLTENAIRPFVIGRKNHLFSDSVAGANASMNLYGLIESAKANSIEPYAYLKMLFTELPKASSLEDIEALLPIKERRADISDKRDQGGKHPCAVGGLQSHQASRGQTECKSDILRYQKLLRRGNSMPTSRNQGKKSGAWSLDSYEFETSNYVIVKNGTRRDSSTGRLTSDTAKKKRATATGKK